MSISGLRVTVTGTVLVFACWAFVKKQSEFSVLESPFSRNILPNFEIRNKILSILANDMKPTQSKAALEAKFARLRSQLYKENKTVGLLQLEAAASYEADLEVATETEKMRSDVVRLQKHSEGSVLPALRVVSSILRENNANAAQQAREKLILLAAQIANHSLNMNSTALCPGDACNESSQIRKHIRNWPSSKAEVNVFDHVPSRLYTGNFNTLYA